MATSNDAHNFLNKGRYDLPGEVLINPPFKILFLFFIIVCFSKLFGGIFLFRGQYTPFS